MLYGVDLAWARFELSALMVIGTDCICSYRSNYHPINNIYIPSLQGFKVRLFNVTFNNIYVISWGSVLLVYETWTPGENRRLVASHWQTLSYNVVSSTPRHERGFKLTTLVVIGTDCTAHDHDSPEMMLQKIQGKQKDIRLYFFIIKEDCLYKSWWYLYQYIYI